MTRRRVKEDVVIRPSFRIYRVRLVLATLLTSAVVGLQLWDRWNTNARLPLIVFWFLFLGVFAVLLVLFFRRGEILLADGKLTRWNLVGISRTYEVADIGGMARRDVDYPFVAAPTQYVIVYDKARRCLFKMDRPFWDRTDLSRLHSFLGGQMKTERVSVWALNDEFAGSVVGAALHPFLTLAVELVAAIALIVGIVVVQDAFFHR